MAMKIVGFMVRLKLVANLPLVLKYFLGLNTTTFTSTKELFSANPATDSWRFEVVYQFSKGQSSSSMIFRLNECPIDGSCSLNPINDSLFTIFE
jgi:hypothetical protein